MALGEFIALPNVVVSYGCFSLIEAPIIRNKQLCVLVPEDVLF